MFWRMLAAADSRRTMFSPSRVEAAFACPRRRGPRVEGLSGSRCLAWLGLAWLGLAWLGLAWRGVAWRGVSWRGVAWLGLAWLGPVRPGPAMARSGCLGRPGVFDVLGVLAPVACPARTGSLWSPCPAGRPACLNARDPRTVRNTSARGRNATGRRARAWISAQARPGRGSGGLHGQACRRPFRSLCTW